MTTQYIKQDLTDRNISIGEIASNPLNNLDYCQLIVKMYRI
jgi:hypothetical protein